MKDINASKKLFFDYLESVKKEDSILIEALQKGFGALFESLIEDDYHLFGTYKDIPVYIEITVESVDTTHNPAIRGSRERGGLQLEPDEAEHYEINDYKATAKLTVLHMTDIEYEKTEQVMTVNVKEFANIMTDSGENLNEYTLNIIDDHIDDFVPDTSHGEPPDDDYSEDNF